MSNAYPRRQEDEFRLGDVSCIGQIQRDVVGILDDNRNHRPLIRKGNGRHGNGNDLRLTLRHDEQNIIDSLMPGGAD